MGLSSQAKAQSSVEYLVIVALTFAIIVPAAYIFYNYSLESTNEIKDSQVLEIGRTVIDSAQAIYYSGQGSKTVVELRIPDNVYNVSILDGRELSFTLRTPFGLSDAVFFSKVNISGISSNCYANACLIPELTVPGTLKLKIEAQNQDTVTLIPI